MREEDGPGQDAGDTPSSRTQPTASPRINAGKKRDADEAEAAEGKGDAEVEAMEQSQRV